MTECLHKAIYGALCKEAAFELQWLWTFESIYLCWGRFTEAIFSIWTREFQEIEICSETSCLFQKVSFAFAPTLALFARYIWSHMSSMKMPQCKKVYYISLHENIMKPSHHILAFFRTEPSPCPCGTQGKESTDTQNYQALSTEQYVADTNVYSEMGLIWRKSLDLFIVSVFRIA